MNPVIISALPYIAIFGAVIAVVTLAIFAYFGRLKEAPPYMFAAGALIAFALAIFLTFDERGAGSIWPATTLFILCVVFAYFPQLDSLNAGVLSIKMGRQLDRAEELLQKIKSIAAMNARVTYTILAWDGRLDGISTQEKQSLVDQIDTQLKIYGITPPEIETIKGDLIYVIGLDLAHTFENALTNHEAVVDKNGRQRLGLRKLREMSPLQLGIYLKAEIQLEHLPPGDSEKFSRFADRLTELYAGCVAIGNFTPETIQFMNEIYPFHGEELTAYALK